MSTPLQRQHYIVSLLKNRNVSKEELMEKIVDYFDLDSYSESTFERDKSVINANPLFPSVVFNRRENAYSLCRDELYLLSQSELYYLILENDFLLSSINKNGLLSEAIIFETRKFTGTECLSVLRKAIENQQEVSFDYFYYDTQETKTKTVQPYRLKLKDFRWYLLAQDDSGVAFKSYGLERISNLEVLNQTFEAQDIDFDQPYHDAFGMFTDGDAKKIVLEFDRRDGNYLISNPIHQSQKVTTLPDKVRIELYIKPTLDLIMELMKRTWSIKIIEPKWLRDQFVEYWNKAISLNCNS